MASICIHCMHLLVNNSQELCRRTGIIYASQNQKKKKLKMKKKKTYFFVEFELHQCLPPGLPFLSYADVAETCFATHSNARYVAQSKLERFCSKFYYKSCQVKTNSANSEDCDRHLSLYHTGTIKLLGHVKFFSVTINMLYLCFLLAWILLCLLCLCGPEFTTGKNMALCRYLTTFINYCYDYLFYCHTDL